MLKAFVILFACLAIIFVLLAQGGDNTDSRAIATLAYIPAGVCVVIDAILWLIVVLK